MDSGTTGTPKGVILTHGNIIASASGLIYQMASTPNLCSKELFSKNSQLIYFCIQNEYRLIPSDVLLSYLPLAHIMERVSEVRPH